MFLTFACSVCASIKWSNGACFRDDGMLAINEVSSCDVLMALFLEHYNSGDDNSVATWDRLQGPALAFTVCAQAGPSGQCLGV